LQSCEAKEAIVHVTKKEAHVFIVLAAVLLLLWLGGFLVFHVAGGLIHLLLVVAIIALIIHLMRPRTVV
jgi:bacteriorhodopsin